MVPSIVSICAPQPFRLSTSPKEAFVHASWLSAEEVILACLVEGDRVLLLGRAGTGKTLLLHRLSMRLRALGRCAHLIREGELPPGLRESDILLVDEADTLAASLEHLFNLPNPTVFAGLPPFRDRVERSIGLVGAVTLEPLATEEIARFIVSRLEAADRSRAMFSPEAILGLARHSDGLFRVITILASASLFFAELRQAGSVEAADVDEAAAMRLAITQDDARVPAIRPTPEICPPPPTRRHVLPRTLAALALSAVLGIGLGVVAKSGSLRHVAPAARVLLAPFAATPAPTATPADLPTAIAPSEAAPPPPETVSVPAAPRPRPLTIAFRGPVSSTKPGQDGRMLLRLQLADEANHGPVKAWVHGSDRFTGNGRLEGALARDGRVTLSGRLMLGGHEFECAVLAALEGNRLVGEATFVRPATGESSRSTFTLSRS